MFKPVTRKGINCKECLGDLFKADFNSEYKPVWICACCLNETTRRIHKSKEQVNV